MASDGLDPGGQGGTDSRWRGGGGCDDARAVRHHVAHASPEDPDRRLNAFTLLTVCFSALSGFLFGYDLCIVNVALRFVAAHFHLSTAGEESVVSFVFIGAAVGSLLGAPAADKWGRKPAIVTCSALFALSAVIMMLAPTFATLICGRFVVGVAIGGSSTCVSVYIAELSKPALRGVLVSVNEVALCFGCLVAILTGISLQATDGGWRYMLGLAAVPATIQFFGMLALLPESPRWLLANGRGGEAMQVVRRIYAPDTDAAGAAVDSMQEGSARDGAVTQRVSMIHTLRGVWADKSQRSALLLSVCVAMAQNLTASNAVLYFSTELFAEAGVHGLEASIGIGVAKFVGVCVAMVLIPRVGRRTLLMAGTVVEAAAYLLLSASFFFLPPASHELGIAGVGLILVFILAWNSSWAPLMFVVCSEVLPAKARGVGMGAALTAFWLTSFLTNQLLLSLVELVGDAAAFLFLAVTTLLALLFVYRRVPETKDKALHEIAQLFRDMHGGGGAVDACGDGLAGPERPPGHHLVPNRSDNDVLPTAMRAANAPLGAGSGNRLRGVELTAAHSRRSAGAVTAL